MAGIGNAIGTPFKRKAGFPSTLTDGTCSMRQVIRGDYLCTDLTFTALGFAGVEDTDWECVETVQISWVPQVPTNLAGTVISDTQIDITWDDAASANDGLKIYLSTDGGVNYTYNSTVAFGVETKSLTGLIENTSYTIKLVTYSSLGESPCLNTPTLSTWNLHDADTNAYTAVAVGGQLWMKENLMTTKYNDGSAITRVTDNTAWAALITEAYDWYGSNINNKPLYGATYNGYTIDSGKLAPIQWLIPCNGDFNRLSAYLGGDVGGGGKLKEAGTTYWDAPNTGADNSSGWTGRGGGYRVNTTGAFASVKVSGIWYSTTLNSGDPYIIALGSTSADIIRNSFAKKFGFSIRCLLDKTWYGEVGLFYGDSVTSGSGASPATNRWTTLFKTAKYITEVNNGVSSQALQNTSDPASVGNFRDNVTANVTDRVASERKSICIAYGTNDVGFNFPAWTVAEFKKQYREVIQIINAKGWLKHNIVLVSPHYTTQTGRDAYVAPFGVPVAATEQRLADHVEAVREVAIEYQCQFVDLYTYMKNNGGATLLAVDGLHPNNTGHAAISTYIQSVLI